MSDVGSARISIGFLALALAGIACARGPGSPAVGAPDVEGFDPGLLVDVLSPDAIRSIDRPGFEAVEDAAGWLSPRDPVLVVELGARARAYPLAIMTWHEIVNDELGDRKLAVTYCPLCNSGIVFDRVVDGRALEFGVSGKLYQSDLVMYDRQTESLWPQFIGRAVLGDLKGETLSPVASSLVSFDEFRVAHPRGRVLERPAGRTYGSNPYPGYERRGKPFEDFFSGDVDPRLDPMARVIGVAVGRTALAFPTARLERTGNPAVVAARVGRTDVVVFWGGTTASALDSEEIASGRAVGSSGVFEPRLDGRRLRFAVRDGEIVDEATGSRWSVLGRAESGPHEGKRLRALDHVDAFWFAWAAFVPFTEVWGGS